MTHSEQEQNQTSFKNYSNATLPINISNGIFLDAKKSRKFGNKLADNYCQAQPYPHIVIDNFLPNAFIDESNRIFITTGFISTINYPEGLAGIVAHEIAHIKDI